MANSVGADDDQTTESGLIDKVLSPIAWFLRGLGAVAVILYLTFFDKFLILNASTLIDGEIRVLEYIQGAATSTDALSFEPGASVGVEVIPFVEANVPAILFMVICILAAILVVTYIVKIFKSVQSEWKKVRKCKWRGWGIFKCLFRAFWVLIQVVLIVLLTVMVVVVLLVNVDALLTVVA
jgi:hypothetical protein